MKKYLIIIALLLTPAASFAQQNSLIAMAASDLHLENQISNNDLIPVKNQIVRKEKNGSITITSKNPFADIAPAAGK